MKQKIIYTVSQLNSLIKKLISSSFQEIYVEGEVSNLKPYSSGHRYFSLKDEKSQVRCILFYDSYIKLKFKLENGLKVICYGKVDYYTVRGEIDLIVYEITPKGIGALQLAFEQLKKKLEAEGLFDPKRKKKIPLLPRKIGIITSPDGAAIRDILTVIKRRFANVYLILYPVKVQGDTAKYEISEGIKFMNEQFPYLDVLLVGRGGGSIEDLWAFNEEVVARAIVDSKIPIISCVGHEIDYTIADYVADLRAPTPSAAAELVVKSKEDLRHKIENLKIRLVQHITQQIRFYHSKLQNLVNSRVLRMPEVIYEDKMKEIMEHENTIKLFLKHYLEKIEHKINLYKEKLTLLSPNNILSRGYAIVWYKDKILRNTNLIKEDVDVKVQLQKGTFISKVKEILN